MYKYNVYTVAMASLFFSGHLFGVTSAGDAPTGTMTASPNLTYMGVGMSMTFTASALADNDCRDGTAVADDTPTTIAYTADNGATVGALNGMTVGVVFPAAKADVIVKLRVDDVGTVHNDGGLVDVASKTIRVRKPTSCVANGNENISSPILGVRYKHIVKDDSTPIADFTVAGPDALEKLDGSVKGKVDDNTGFVNSRSLSTNGNWLSTAIDTLSAQGGFNDNFGMPASDLEALKTEAANSGATSKYTLYIATSVHQYAVRIYATVHPLSGSFQRTAAIVLKKKNGAWELDTYGPF